MAVTVGCPLLCSLLLAQVCSVYPLSDPAFTRSTQQHAEEPLVAGGNSGLAKVPYSSGQSHSQRIESTRDKTEDIRQTRRPRSVHGARDKEFQSTRTFNNCYRKMCRCAGTYADCSQNGGKLDHIPDLPAGIVFLNFSFNDLKKIDRDDFFANVSNITGLDLRGNDLSYISDGAFGVLQKLKQLNIGENDQLGYDTLTLALVPTLEELDVSWGNLRIIPDDLFSKHQMPQLNTLNLQGNFLVTLNMEALQPLCRLEKFNAEDCQVTTFTPASMNSLISLDLSYNAIKSFPQSCYFGTIPYFPNLQTLALRNNGMNNLSTYRTCYPELQTIDLSENTFSSLPSGVFSGERFPHLQTLTITSTQLKVIERHAFLASPVQLLSLAGNTIDFVDEHAVDAEAFAGLRCVRELYLDNNTLGHIDDSRFQDLFGDLKSLQVFSLSSTGLTAVSAQTFRDLATIRQLLLDGNLLLTVPDGAFDNNVNLTSLRLQTNRISVIREQTFGESTRNRLQHLDLHDNPFHCDCNLAWFQQWFLSDQKVFDNRDSCHCKNLKDADVDSFECKETPQGCPQTWKIATIVFSVVMGLLLIAAIVVAIVLVVRWYGRRRKRCANDTERSSLVTTEKQDKKRASLSAKSSASGDGQDNDGDDKSVTHPKEIIGGTPAVMIMSSNHSSGTPDETSPA